MKISTESMQIGALAREAAVNVETIRFYQRKGLMQEPDRLGSSIRRYSESHLARLRFIKSAQRLGFNLDEVAELLALDDGAHCTLARQLGEQKLADVRTRLSDLQKIEVALTALVVRCHATKGRIRCPMIATLQMGLTLETTG